VNRHIQNSNLKPNWKDRGKYPAASFLIAQIGNFQKPNSAAAHSAEAEARMIGEVENLPSRFQPHAFLGTSDL
jgi:hypothetical protein